MTRDRSRRRWSWIPTPHQGNGTAEVVDAWPWAHLLDFYEEDIYPWPKAKEEFAVPMGQGTSDGEYLEILRDHLPGVLDRVRPSLVIYNAGSDVLASDPLTRLALTVEGMVDRDLYVVTTSAREKRAGRDAPLGWVRFAILGSSRAIHRSDFDAV